MITSNYNNRTRTSSSSELVWLCPDLVVYDDLINGDEDWWANLLAFMWRLYVRLMPQDGAKRKPPLVAAPDPANRRVYAIPGAVRGPIHYWSGHVGPWPRPAIAHSRLSAVADLE